MTTPSNIQALSIVQTLQKLGYSGKRTPNGKTYSGKSKLYLMMRDAGFPKPIKMADKVLWIEHEIDQWLLDQIAKRDGV